MAYPSPPWNDAQLAEAVAGASTLADVARRLGYRGRSRNKAIVAGIDRLELDTSHMAGRGWARGLKRSGAPAKAGANARPAGRPRAWSDDDLAEAVASEMSIAAVIRRLGFRPSGGMHQMIVHHITRLGLDTSHMTGRGWARGKRGVTSHPRPLSEVLVKGSAYQNSGKLRRRLIRAGLKARRCKRCGIDEWLGRPIPLELDHINGDRTDNRLENLRILCPNCHSQTETWCRTKQRPA
jgi:hypothetical protein